MTDTQAGATVPIIQMERITKTFPGGVVANNDISLAVAEGTIHAIIGENGAGKSTLMGVLYGRIQPDSGRILLRGAPVRIDSPARAIALGIGMVTQHTTMIQALSVLDNIVLGAEPAHLGVLNRRAARERVTALAERLGIAGDWTAQIAAGRISVAALQKAEIVKVLYRGARILILDEPTATLAPQEAEALFRLLHTLSEAGTTVLFITHKLREVMEHSAAVTVLRGGKCVGERRTSDTSPGELLRLMLGRTGGVELGPEGEPEPAPALAAEQTAGPPVLELGSVRVLNDRRAPAVRDFSLEVRAGEVVGVAGVDGSGQKELAEAIVGLRPLAGGGIRLDSEEVGGLSIARRRARGVAWVPEDRHREGLVLDFTLAENLILGRERDPAVGGGALLDLARIRREGDAVVQESRVRAPDAGVAARALSGGNQQKVVIARALEERPRLLVAMQPTRGLDVDAARFVYDRLRAALAGGMAILLFSLDLDEIFELSHRIAVMYNGGLAGVVPRAAATPDGIGRLMLGAAQ